MLSPCSIWLVITQIVGTMFNHIQVLAHCTYTCTYIKTSGFSGFHFLLFFIKIYTYSDSSLFWTETSFSFRSKACKVFAIWDLFWLLLLSTVVTTLFFFTSHSENTHTYIYTYIFIDYNCVLCYLNKESLWLSHELRVYFFLSMSHLFLPLIKTWMDSYM